MNMSVLSRVSQLSNSSAVRPGCNQSGVGQLGSWSAGPSPWCQPSAGVGENPQFLFEIAQLAAVSLGFNYKAWCPEPIFGKLRRMKFVFL